MHGGRVVAVWRFLMAGLIGIDGGNVDLLADFGAGQAVACAACVGDALAVGKPAVVDTAVIHTVAVTDFGGECVAFAGVAG